MTKNQKYMSADKKSLYLCTFITVVFSLFILNVDFISNYIISYKPHLNTISTQLAEQQEVSKLKTQTLLLAVAVSIFFSIIGWISYVIIRTKSIPPKSIKFPFGMVQLFGRDALLIGWLGLCISLTLIALNMYRLYDIWSLIGK